MRQARLWAMWVTMVAGAAAFWLLVFWSIADAFTCTPTGCSFDATWTEPTTVQGGAALDNLTSTTLRYTISKGNAGAGPAKVVTVPASKPTGGGTVTTTITDTTLLPGDNYVINGTAVATNPSGVSPASAPFTSITIPRAGEVPPGTPAGGSFK